MANTSMYQTSGGFESGLRSGAMLGQAFQQRQSRNAMQDAAALIQQGQDPNAVIQQLMSTDPAAAQQLLNMQTQQQQQAIQKQEMGMLQQKYGMQKLQMAGLPLFGAIMQDDPKVQDKLIDEASAVFKGQSDGVYDALQSIKQMPLDGRVNALGGIVKSLRQAGVFPDDPSQMMQGQSADIAKFEYWKQLNPNATPEQAQQMYNKIIDPYSRAYATGLAKIETEQGLNPVLAAREAGKTEAVEGTATGQAKLQQEQQAVAKGQSAVDADKEQKAKALEASKEALRLTESIAGNKNLGMVTGVAALTPTLNPESQDIINQANQLLALLTAENLKLMSGVLSETDIKMLRDLSSGLNVSEKGIKGSEQAIRARLNDIASKLRTTLQGKGALESAQQPAQQQSGRTIGRFKIEVE